MNLSWILLLPCDSLHTTFNQTLQHIKEKQNCWTNIYYTHIAMCSPLHPRLHLIEKKKKLMLTFLRLFFLYRCCICNERKEKKPAWIKLHGIQIPVTQKYNWYQNKKKTARRNKWKKENCKEARQQLGKKGEVTHTHTKKKRKKRKKI